jgi:hypothetical protein
VLLLLDSGAHKAAVRPTTNDKAGFPVTLSRSAAQSYITCKAFLEATGLTNAGLLPASWNAEEQCLEWDIPHSESPTEQ